ncbi:MAG TPA: hypothetical protein PL110_00580 [Candidatus Eremiobacteraeota bacterium]|nr:MAG: Sigma-70, region 4 [bacterium ADurb.Bin363]HPZ06582.1 hypothetical protein [Candidatus Eremiobacteraeota bacterium]
MFKEREEELELVKAIKKNDEEEWKKFVANYSKLIFNAIRQWCQPYCHKSHSNYMCPWDISSSSSFVNQKEICNEVMDMYLFSLEELRKRIVKFRGESRLSTFIVASMKYIKLDYFRQKYGRLQLPLVIKKSTQKTQEIYKLLCRGKEQEYIAGQLNIPVYEVNNIEKDIRQKLREKNQEWEHLDGWIAMKQDPQPLIIENENDIIDQTPVYSDITPEEREIALCIKNALKELPPVQQRILQLRFQKRLTVSHIESMLEKLSFLNLTNQKQIYKEIDESLMSIARYVKAYYNLKGDISGEVKKCVKELVEKLMLLSEEEPGLSA